MDMKLPAHAAACTVATISPPALWELEQRRIEVKREYTECIEELRIDFDSPPLDDG
jgi:hypothetical protein